MDILVKALKELVDDMESKGKFIGLTRGQRPIVLVDEPSKGANIIKIDYLTKQFQYDSFKRATKMYQDIILDEDD